MHAQFFLDTVLEHGTEGCNYLLAVDVDMNTVDGYAISSWERGYGDFEFVLDLDTLHPVPWIPGTAMVVCDLAWLDDGHTPVAESPRQILRAQAERAAEQGLVAYAGTELEFIVFNDTYEQAWTSGYRDLTPANQYNVDYSLLGTSRVEPLLRDIRNGMFGAGLVVESAKGECNLGQHEIAFKYDEVVRTADKHSIYKNGAKEIASQHGKALTFMAKFDQREGNSCHIHMSLRGDDGRIVFDEGDGPTPMFRELRRRHPGHHVRADLALRPEHQLLQAVPGRAASPRPRRHGGSTTAPARCGSSATARGCGWRTGCPAATSTPTSRWRGCSPAGCAASSRSCRSSPPSRATPTCPTTQRCRRRCAARGTCSPRRAPRARSSATRWSTTTSTTPTSSCRRSTPPSPTGSATASFERM